MTRITHMPVMLNEMLDALAPRDGAVYVDATFGAGGYSRALLEAANCSVWAIDRDPVAVAIGKDLARHYDRRLMVLSGLFGDMKALLADVGVGKVDGIALDLGVSSMQIDNAERGFSFREDGPLDMRMSGADGDMATAADVVNHMTEGELADIIYTYGEERASRRISRAIVQLREKEPINRTVQLATLVRSVVRKTKKGIDTSSDVVKNHGYKKNGLRPKQYKKYNPFYDIDEVKEFEKQLAVKLRKKGHFVYQK